MIFHVCDVEIQVLLSVSDSEGKVKGHLGPSQFDNAIRREVSVLIPRAASTFSSLIQHTQLQ